MVYRTRYLSTEPKFSAFFHDSSCIKAGSLINLGWSDFFAIFEIGHIAADQVCFYEFNSKIPAKLAKRTHASHVRQSFFIFITGTLHFLH